MNKMANAAAEKTAPPGKAAAKPRHTKTLGDRIRENWQLYLLLVIPIVITSIYKYISMYGVQIAKKAADVSFV